MAFLIIFLVALAISGVGFHRYIWFISIGYGFSIAGIGAALLIYFGITGRVPQLLLPSGHAAGD